MNLSPQSRRQGADPPLEIYTKYGYLPVFQQAQVLLSVNGIYRATAAAMPIQPSLSRLDWGVLIPPLVIESVSTGESIIIKFDTRRRLTPGLKLSGKDIQILVPRWTAAVILVGTVLTVGMDQYQKFLEIQKLKLEIEQLRQELKKFDHKKLQDSQNPIGNAIQYHVRNFDYYLNQPNIRDVQINGIPVKKDGKRIRRKR